jgi:hypothetical protein
VLPDQVAAVEAAEAARRGVDHWEQVEVRRRLLAERLVQRALHVIELREADPPRALAGLLDEAGAGRVQQLQHLAQLRRRDVDVGDVPLDLLDDVGGAAAQVAAAQQAERDQQVDERHDRPLAPVPRAEAGRVHHHRRPQAEALERHADDVGALLRQLAALVDARVLLAYLRR